ncbi:uncharacterized protein GVI51_K09405 [Nakaseomyces glabratus]|uniref:diacylglycerol cholinephosphotransferase n=2 Tax=Candida glabrata TaxID=5478 RepID=Q6FMA8_CANGA|nr:uncharacterized protein CAGL0K09570g [Nakaseomyces glabratus]KAH7582411.1 CDP-alcohol phosphatidyltransferase [Nakaseomyces glabratus]KAH7583319.1 CDP-alcohol phosphatidyltransferase [Nakaseomyces glabratus]KAH7584742.1 CDP-alcohol phosphatidyltransferase [Nakaseomyces glabratus]KAH7596343.1 CDP-alcohol phosphatidyltransferase [Nakaseomyces glabratus]KAH7597201.1 CDP-alcohol phosphatidyltransferase [Nakaseomyces glabratus]|eukprot:XP_448636.1 uncharacterized protein CAGL0K09570g [[Candida] glabrata]
MGYFIPKEAIANLKYYKYQSEDRSLISNYILRPYWRWFSQLFPMWMAPNLVTLSGLGFIILNVLTVLYYDPYLNTETPRWTYFSYALGLFLYQTFDACDGMHARRTGQSSPLGELFDHCIDSLNTTLSLFPVCSMLGCGYSMILIGTQFMVLGNFYLSTWEEFYTHRLFLSEFSGPVEGILLLVFQFILCGLFGTQRVWHTKLLSIHLPLTIGNSDIFELETVHLMICFSTFALLFNILAATSNVFQYFKEHNKKNDMEEVEAEKKEAMIALMPFFIYFATVFALVAVDNLFISFPFIISVGLTMAFVVGRMIVGHLTKQKFPLVNFPMFIPISQLIMYIIFVCYFKSDRETMVLALLWGGFGVSLGIHAMFINEIIYEFTTYLDVYALSIKHPKST